MGNGADKEDEANTVLVCWRTRGRKAFYGPFTLRSLAAVVTASLFLALHVAPQDVLSEHPTYIDCYLRLACMARARGSHKEALQYAQVGADGWAEEI